MSEGQKERFGRAFVIAAACGAEEDFTCAVFADDLEGVDATVSQRGITVDFQLKSTSVPKGRGTDLLFDLDVRTYDLLRGPVRSGLGVLALVVLHEETESWLTMTEASSTLNHCAYYLVLHGMPPTANTSKIRLTVPRANILNQEAMRELMRASRGRFTT
jgi:hypothetical protein